MAEHPEPFSVDVGSKLLLGAILLSVFGVLALILLPVATAFAPATEPDAGLGRIIGAVFPGIGLLLVALVLGVIAGILLGYAHNKYPREG